MRERERMPADFHKTGLDGAVLSVVLRCLHDNCKTRACTFSLDSNRLVTKPVLLRRELWFQAFCPFEICI